MKTLIHGQSVHSLLVLLILSAVSHCWAWPTWYPHPHPGGSTNGASTLQSLSSNPQLHPQQLAAQRDFFSDPTDSDFSDSHLAASQRSPHKTTSYRARLWQLSLQRTVPRSKRPSVLGLDNMEFAAAILDRSKGEFPDASTMQTTPPLGRPLVSRRPPVRQRPSLSFGQFSPGNGRLSTNVGVPGLSRMIQEQNTRRVQQQQEDAKLRKILENLRNRGR